MKSESYPQYAIVQGNTAVDLTEELNAVLRKLKDYEPEVTFEGLIARVKYVTRDGNIPESISEEYELQGVRLTCEDCPFFEPIMKRDGTPDERKKSGGCPFTKNGMTYRSCKACNTLFQMVNNGEVRLCLAK